jgi:hypothetical protein
MAYFESSVDTGEDGCCGSLDVVVEHEVVGSVSLEEVDGVLRLEVLVLDQGLGPAEVDRGHELVDDFEILFP